MSADPILQRRLAFDTMVLSAFAASGLVDALRAVGLRLPCTGSQFRAWAKANGLLL